MSAERPSRARRAPLPRTAPIRSAAAALRPAEVPEEARAAASGVVERAVDNAYRVLEEQLEKGRDVASHHHSKAAPHAPQGRGGGAIASEDARDLAQGAVRIWSEMVVLWLDFLGPLAPESLRDAVREVPHRFASATSGAAASPARAGGAPPLAGLEIALEITAPAPVEITVQLAPEARAKGLTVQSLQAVGAASKPPIPGATIGEHEGRPRLRLAIPDGQPAGTYLGMIIDDARAEPCGSLRVVVQG